MYSLTLSMGLPPWAILLAPMLSKGPDTPQSLLYANLQPTCILCHVGVTWRDIECGCANSKIFFATVFKSLAHGQEIIKVTLDIYYEF